MVRNYFLINVLLITIIVFLGLKFYKIYSYTLEVPAGTAAENAQKGASAAKGEDRFPDAGLFQSISNMDLFRPTRSPYKEEVAQQDAVPRIPPRVFGTVILGDEKSAILEDPNTKTTRLYKVNEAIGGYVVTDILEDKVVLSWNGEKSDIRLREEKKGLPPVKQMVIPQPQQQQQQPPQQQLQPQIPQQPGQRPVPQRPNPQQRPIPPTPMQRR